MNRIEVTRGISVTKLEKLNKFQFLEEDWEP